MSDGPHPLPVTATFLRAYHLVWHNRLRVMRGAAIPFLMLSVASALHSLLVGSIPPNTDPSKYFATISHPRLIAFGATEMIGSWTLMSFNVSWRRFLLMLPTEVEPFYFRRPLFRYVVALFVTTLATISILGLAITVTDHLLSLIDPGLRDHQAPTRSITVPLYLTASAAALIGLIGLIARHYPLYTRLLTDTPEFNLKQIRAAMRGNVMRLLVTLTLTFCTLTFGVMFAMSPLVLMHIAPDNIALAAIRGISSATILVGTTALLSAVAGLVYDFAFHGNGNVHA